MPEVPARPVRETTPAAPPRYAPPDDPAGRSPHPPLRYNPQERYNAPAAQTSARPANAGVDASMPSGHSGSPGAAGTPIVAGVPYATCAPPPSAPEPDHGSPRALHREPIPRSTHQRGA